MEAEEFIPLGVGETLGAFYSENYMLHDLAERYEIDVEVLTVIRERKEEISAAADASPGSSRSGKSDDFCSGQGGSEVSSCAAAELTDGSDVATPANRRLRARKRRMAAARSQSPPPELPLLKVPPHLRGSFHAHLPASSSDGCSARGFESSDDNFRLASTKQLVRSRVPSMRSSSPEDGQFGGSWHSSDEFENEQEVDVEAPEVPAATLDAWRAWLNLRWTISDTSYNERLLVQALELFPECSRQHFEPPTFADW